MFTLSVLIDRIHLDREVSAARKYDHRVHVPAGSETKQAFSATMLKSSESFTWFLSSKRERERDART
jgi:hypothetical protein